MSIGFSSLVSGLAGTPQAQVQSTDAARAHDAAQQVRARQSVERAADAAERTEQDTQASDRDADGRRPWELPTAARPGDDSAATPATPDNPTASRDATGQIGRQIDLSG